MPRVKIKQNFDDFIFNQPKTARVFLQNLQQIFTPFKVVNLLKFLSKFVAIVDKHKHQKFNHQLKNSQYLKTNFFIKNI